MLNRIICDPVFGVFCTWVRYVFCFFFSSRRRHTRWTGDWSSDVCSSDLVGFSGARPVVLTSIAEVVISPDLLDRTYMLPSEPIIDHDEGQPNQPMHGRRSEERRVGKECRSRWSAYH